MILIIPTIRTPTLIRTHTTRCPAAIEALTTTRDAVVQSASHAVCLLRGTESLLLLLIIIIITGVPNAVTLPVAAWARPRVLLIPLANQAEEDRDNRREEDAKRIPLMKFWDLHCRMLPKEPWLPHQ